MSTGGTSGGSSNLWGGISNLSFFAGGAGGGGMSSSLGSATSQLLSGISRLIDRLADSISVDLALHQNQLLIGMRIYTNRLIASLKGISASSGSGPGGTALKSTSLLGRLMAGLGIKGVQGFAAIGGQVGGALAGGAGIVAGLGPAAAAVVAGLGLLTAALARAYRSLVAFSTKALSLAERFREAPAMAEIAAFEGVQDMLRNIRVGQALSGTQRGLQDEFRELKNTFAPFMAGWEEFRQLVATLLLKLLNSVAVEVVEFLKFIIVHLADMLDTMVFWKDLDFAKEIRKAIEDAEKFKGQGAIPGLRAIRDLEKGLAGF